MVAKNRTEQNAQSSALFLNTPDRCVTAFRAAEPSQILESLTDSFKTVFAPCHALSEIRLIFLSFVSAEITICFPISLL